MTENSVMTMAKFIHSHPEHQMQPPRVWRTHYEDECGRGNNIYSFSALKQYPSLVRIQKTGRNSFYGSAKLPAKVLSESQIIASHGSNSQKKDRRLNFKKEEKHQLELNYDAESALKEIEQIMLSASEKIQQVLKRTLVK